jgi:hypothetical protein
MIFILFAAKIAAERQFFCTLPFNLRGAYKRVIFHQMEPYHAKHYAYELSLQKLTVPLTDAQVDLNPHQVVVTPVCFPFPCLR